MSNEVLERDEEAGAGRRMDPVAEYRKVEGFPGYRVGNDGSVWSLWQRVGLGYPNGTTFKIGRHWKRMRPGRLGTGYLQILLCRGGVKYPKTVHRLVLEAFVGPCPEGMEACHFPDRDPSNNRLSNLRWDTRSENHRDRRRGTLPVLEKRCPQCEQVKPRNEFGNRPRRFGGIACWCLECERKCQAQKRRKRDERRSQVAP